MTRDEEAAIGIERADLFEAQDVSPDGVIVFLASLLASLVLTCLLVWGVWGVFVRVLPTAGPSPVPKLTQIPPEPRIQADPHLDVWRLRANEDAVLNSYGWADRQAGTVRIPIDRAMDLLVERGLPVESPTAPSPGVADTGPESGGPQTGQPMPRFHPAQPSAQGTP
jgi:hypothetical protein